MKPADHFPAGLRILAVDDDPISLAILRRMLQECSYHVTICGRATEALELLREDKDKFDLVISDVYMPDMDGFKLLELVGLEMDLPVIMMSADGETSIVMKGITHGACYYLLKPVRIEELRNIWQHVVRKLRREPKEHSASFEEGKINQQGGTRYADSTPSATDMTDCMWRNKKKEAKEDEEDHEQDNTSDLSMLKPPVVWSVDLHQQFVSAVNQLGIDKAVPKTILELMNVHGLTHENVASHLQVYLLYLKRLSGVTIQPNNLRASSDGQDAGYGGLIGLNQMLDYKTAVTNGRLPVQGRAVLHNANMVGGVGGASSGMLGISRPTDPYLLVQIAALQSMPLSRPEMEGSSPGNQAALLQSLSALDFNPLCQSHLLSGIGPLQQQDDWPSLKAIQQPLDMGSLEGSNRNFAGSTSEELTIQVLQQRAQQQGEGSPVNLPQATRILKLLSSNVNLGQADLMPNVVGAIPSTAIGLSNMCHNDRELGSFSSFSNASGSLIRSSIADTQNMSFIGSSGSSGCSFMELMNHGIDEDQDYYLKAMTQQQVEGMLYEPEDTSSGDQSESNTIFQLEGANDIFTFQATSLNSANTQVFNERTLMAICDLDDRTFGQNSKLQVNVLQCKYMVNTILASKCYLMEQTCTSSADPIYKELFRIVKKADLIVQECSDEPLKLKSLLAQMDNVHAFVDVTVDWQWCTRLFRNDVKDCTWASVHSTFEQLKQQDLTQNKKFWDAHIAELQNQSMSTTVDPRMGERSNLADYLQGRVQNVMNAYDSLQGLLPWFVGTSDPEAKRGEFLGMGTFGSVSQYTWFGMECAEKSFNPFLCEKQEHDFENEVGVMACLNHPHVVRLICCHQDSTKCSIVMELMPTNLERYIAGRKYPFTPQAAVDIMSQIASGMEYLHEQGVVHRDLKPNNILVCPNTNPELSADGYVEVKLADFGLAKTKVYTSASILNSQICGAAPWRAPEAFGEHSSAKKADVYSFAIMCSQILSGNLHPFGYPPLRLLERISSPQHERPSLPSNNNYPAELLSLIRECWAPDSQKRPNFSTICERLQEIRLGLLVCNGM